MSARRLCGPAIGLALLAACGTTGQPSAPVSPSVTPVPSATSTQPPSAAPTSTASAAPSSPASAAPTVTTPVWPTSPRTTPATMPTATLVGIRFGEHAGFDRVVFEFATRVPGYDVRYVTTVVQDPRGEPIPLSGTAYLHVVFRDATAANFGPAHVSALPHYPAVLEVAPAGDFEGYLSFGIGLTARTGFIVWTSTKPNIVVVDIAHPAR